MSKYVWLLIVLVGITLIIGCLPVGVFYGLSITSLIILEMIGLFIGGIGIIGLTWK